MVGLQAPGGLRRYAGPRAEQEEAPAALRAPAGEAGHQVAAWHPLVLRAALAAHGPDHADAIGQAQLGALQRLVELLVPARPHDELRVHGGDEAGRAAVLHHPPDRADGAGHVHAVDADAQDAHWTVFLIIGRCRARSWSRAISHV